MILIYIQLLAINQYLSYILVRQLMGQKQYCQELYFHQKYTLISKTQCVLNRKQIQYVLQQPSIYQVMRMISADRLAFCFINKLSTLGKSLYRVEMTDLYRKEHENQFDALVIYPKSGVSLHELLMNRSRMGKVFKEQDVSYMLQYICRGLKQLQVFKWSNFILTPLLIIFSYDWSFKIFNFILQNCSYNSLLLNSLLANDQRNQSFVASFHHNWKYYLHKIQEISHKQTINLLSLGIICLYMLDYAFKIQSLFDAQTGQFIYGRVLSKINTIKDQKLKWKIWLLTNQYHQQRREIYDFINLNFNQERNMLLRNTTLGIDAQYIRGQLFQASRKKEQKLEESSSPTQFTRSISNKIQKKIMLPQTINVSLKIPNISFTYSNKPTIIPNPQDIKQLANHQSIPNLPLKQKQADRLVVCTRQSKINSWLLDQTQPSPRKNNEQIYQLKEVQVCLKTVEQIETKEQHQCNGGLVEQQKECMASDIDIQDYQQSQGESIIQLNIQELDEQQEQDQFFKDIRARCYSIDRQIEPQPTRVLLSENIMQDIIRQESSMDFSGEIQLDSVEDMQDNVIMRSFEQQQREDQLFVTNLQYY